MMPGRWALRLDILLEWVVSGNAFFSGQREDRVVRGDVTYLG